jgi:hypothetical protein
LHFTALDLPARASFAHRKAQRLSPGQAAHVGFGCTADLKSSEGFALRAGPPTKDLSVPFKAELTFDPVELKIEVTGATKGLNGPADDFEPRLAFSGYGDRQVRKPGRVLTTGDQGQAIQGIVIGTERHGFGGQAFGVRQNEVPDGSPIRLDREINSQRGRAP